MNKTGNHNNHYPYLMNPDYVPLPEHFYPGSLHDSPTTYRSEIDTLTWSFYGDWANNGDDLNTNSIGNEDSSFSVNRRMEEDMINRLYLRDEVGTLDEKQDTNMTFTFAS